MRTLLEISAFIAIAAVAHLALWSPDADGSEEGAGVGGDALLSIKPSSARLQQLVETWDTPPETPDVVETTMQAPDLPQPDAPPLLSAQNTAPQTAPLMQLPDMVSRPDAAPLPVVNTPPPPKPKPEPKPKKKAQTPSAQVNAKRAKGTGGGVAQGNNQAAKTASLSKAKHASLMARWGGQIRARIARRTPRGAGRGTAIVTITVSANGTLRGVSLAKSSGNARLDKLALATVRKAGPFPAAPAALGIRSQTFRLPIKSR